MRFNSVLISSFFASVVLAAPGRLSVDTVPDNTFAGNILTLGHGTIQFVTGTIHAPDISSQEKGTSGYAYVAIDGDQACPGGILRLGVEFTSVASEGTSYQVAYQYGSRGAGRGSFDDLDIAVGHAIKLTVEAPIGAKLGIVKIENLNNNKRATQEIILSDKLCGKTAEWIVENLTNKPNFGTLTFAGAVVGGNDLGPQHPGIVNVIENGKSLTSVLTDGDLVTVKNV